VRAQDSPRDLTPHLLEGVQTQTAECIVIGEILSDHMIVALNKTDLLADPATEVPAAIKKLQKIFAKTKFTDVQMVCALNLSHFQSFSIFFPSFLSRSIMYISFYLRISYLSI
jgi:hypothetical protein